MHEISKFQIITFIVIAMFIFAVGAIYSNTKDAVDNKNQERVYDSKIEEGGATRTQNRIANQDKSELQALNDRITALEQRPQLPQPRYSANSGEYNLKCRIQGIIEDGSIVYMAEDDAVQEAKVNGRSLVMHCSY